MSIQRSRGSLAAVFFIIFLAFFMGFSVNASAEWKQNSKGAYSWYQDGKLQKSKWVDTDYYVNSKGIRVTGWQKINNKWYFFAKNGKVARNKWLKYNGRLCYASESGALLVNGRKKVGDDYYAFNKRGQMLTGKRTYGGKTYYFGTKSGKMLTSKWVTMNKKRYYFGEDGVMVKGAWMGRYCFDKTGACLKNTWKGYRYLMSNGKAAIGYYKVKSYYYYFDPTTYKKLVNTTVTEGGITYVMDSKGHAVKSTDAPATSVNVENQYYSDPYVTDETLLSAIIYCEAGNQSYTGKLAVGLVIMNRKNSSLFPSKLREVIYQKQQFAPARDGSLTRTLKNQSRIDSESKKAAAEVMTLIRKNVKGNKVKLTVSGKEITFKYLFFMTPAAYKRLGLSASYKKIGDHVFFLKWA